MQLPLGMTAVTSIKPMLNARYAAPSFSCPTLSLAGLWPGLQFPYLGRGCRALPRKDKQDPPISVKRVGKDPYDRMEPPVAPILSPLTQGPADRGGCLYSLGFFDISFLSSTWPCLITRRCPLTVLKLKVADVTLWG